MRKTHKQKKISSHHKRHVHMRRGVVFGLCFGALMTAVGLAQLLAAPFIGFSLAPSSQNAGPNQVKTITVQLNSGTKDVNGGSVQVNFDSSRLSFTSLNIATSAFYITGQQVSANSVIFEFRSTALNGTDGFFNLANIRFTTKAAFGTHVTKLTGSAAAYEGRSNPEYYPISSLSASITITGPAAPAPPPPPPPSSPSPSPPSSSPQSPTSRPTSSSSPTSNSSTPTNSNGSGPSAPTRPDSGPSAANSTEPDNTAPEESEPLGEEGLESLPKVALDVSDNMQTVSVPPAAILGILILVADAVFFWYYRKHRHQKVSDRPLEPTDYSPEPMKPEVAVQPPAPVAPSPATPPPPPIPPEPNVTPAMPPPAPHPISGLAIKQTWGDIRKEQAERIAHGDKDLKAERNVPDMFELAKAHPESFGSQSLYDEESGGKSAASKKLKT